jgi:hypothetical protein
MNLKNIVWEMDFINLAQWYALLHMVIDITIKALDFHN